MMIRSTYYQVDESNIEHVRNNMSALDQAEALEPGCETWGILYAGNQRGQMTRWPNGRGAVCYGGDSLWGDWRGDSLILDEDGSEVSEAGINYGDPTKVDEADIAEMDLHEAD